MIDAAAGFTGKVLIDATNPIGKTEFGPGLITGFESSGAETIAVLAPAAKVFKTFNQAGFENMADGTLFKTPPVMFVAGDDDATKPLVLQLVTDAGFEAIDAGKLHAARLLEPLAMLWIEQGRFRGIGPDFAFTLQRKV